MILDENKNVNKKQQSDRNLKKFRHIKLELMLEILKGF